MENQSLEFVIRRVGSVWAGRWKAFSFRFKSGI